MSQFAVVSTDTIKPFLLGFYPDIEHAKRAQGGRPDIWAIFKLVEGETLPTMLTPTPTPEPCKATQ